MTKVLERLKNQNSEFWWRILSFSLSTFVVVPNIAMLIFLTYMAEYNFFSYDFFIEGVFGMKWFFITTVLFIVGASLMFYSPVLCWFLSKKRGTVPALFWGTTIVSSLMFWASAVIHLIYGGNLEQKVFVLVICAASMVHIVTLTCYSAKHQFVSLALIVFVVIFSCFKFSGHVSQIAAIGLKTFGVGGDVEISFKDRVTYSKVEGKLKLLTPKNIYMQKEGADSISVYSLSSVDSYRVNVD
ncbi:hypothetical protein [Vibrio coralliilyticus]|uniref:hypothetical protein n=1 Tax=Vibrio coralliilyticus TaxID=190893 RepID=UPI000C16D116|nr:hypothetical protein [Vibrio coralliilyticus]